MKKLKNIFFVVLFCTIVLLYENVYASTLNRQAMTSTSTNYISNNLDVKLPSEIMLTGTLELHNAERITTLVNQNAGGSSVFYGASNFTNGLFTSASASGGTGYYLYKMNSSDAYVTVYYDNIGTYIGEGENRQVGCVVTISNLKSGTTPVTGNYAYVGFYDRGLAWIILNDGAPNENLNADVEVYFYYSDDSTKTPIDLGEAYIGVGGFSSEKRLYNSGIVSNEQIASWATLSLTEMAALYPDLYANYMGVKGAQWEWVSYDSNVVDSLKAYYISDICFLKYVTSGQSVTVKDEDTTDGATTCAKYDWAQNTGNICTYNFTMTNPTGHNVISNAGTAYDSTVYKDISEFTSYSEYADVTAQRECYMVEVARVTNSSQESGLVYSAGRTDGEPYSVYKFQFGKDVGSVELALYPISICNEVTTPKKTVDKTEAHEQETVTYTITQTMGNMTDSSKRITQHNKYSALKLEDELPEEVELVSATVKNQNGTVIAQISGTSQTSGASNCVLTYNSTTNKFTCTFTSNYLNNVMSYVGETYTFTLVCKVKDLEYTSSQDFIATNDAQVTFDNTYTVSTNEVETQIIYDILTKSINASITDMITEIIGGTSGYEVTFTPDIGYYIDLVEWQTQTERYASTTEALVNVTEIPSTNKTTIPEEKDGSESSYKFEATVTGYNDNLEVQTDITDEEKTSLNYDPFGTTTLTFNEIDNNHYVKVTAVPMKVVINVSKEDVVTGKETQGDAKFVNAEYTVYTDEELTNAVDVIVLDDEGNGISVELALEKTDENGEPYAEYWVQETKAPEGYLIDEEVYYFKITAEEQTVAREKVHNFYMTSKEEVWKGSVSAIKYENLIGTTEERPAAGAVLRLTLNSNPDVYYEATIDENGYLEFINDVLIDYYPYTIPYGVYTITEVKESTAGYHTYFYIQPETVDLRGKHEQVEYRIFGEEPIQAHIKIQKVDSVTGQNVLIAGAKYKIWNCSEGEWVSQVSYPSGEIDVFETSEDENGEVYLITPEEVLAGDYIIYEIEAPEGYYLNDELRIPDDESDIGDSTKGGVLITIDSLAMGLTSGDDLVYDPSRDLVYEVKIENSPLMGQIEIYKTGEVLTDAVYETVFTDFYNADSEEKATFVWEERGLEGCTFKITAVNDIYSPDGQAIYVTAGTSYEITTDENGVATSDYLYVGEYSIEEIETPQGYAKAENIDNVEVTGSGDQYIEVKTEEFSIKNNRQKLYLTFEKIFEEITDDYEFAVDKKAMFGVYAAENIKNVSGNIVATANTLVDVITVYGDTDDNDVTSTVDLPEGTYYVVELDAGSPYAVSDEVRYFTLEYNDSNNLTRVIEGESYTDKYELGELEVIVYPEDIYEEEQIDNYPDLYAIDSEAKVIVRYLELDDTEDDDTDNTVLAPMESIYGDIDDDYNTEQKDITGYTFVKSTNNTSGQMEEEVIEVIYYYTKNTATKVIVRYLELDDTDDNSDNLVLAPTEGLEGKVGDDYETEPKDIENYTYVTSTNNTSGQMEEDVIEVIYYYTRNTQDKDGLESIAKVYGISGKTYGIYLDENCTTPLYKANGEQATYVTDEDGIINVKNMPAGVYYIKELEAPYGYELSDEITQATVYGGMVTVITLEEPYETVELGVKSDIFTKDVIEGVTFEITNEAGELIETVVTDSNGKLWLSIVKYVEGEKYYYQEISGPSMYQIDTAKYEFVYSSDMQLNVINDRKTINKVIIRKTDDETGEALEGCVFTIVLLDENGEEYVNQYGDTIYLVENGVTDENGEYVIENVPYGTYKFKEIVAPEGYELDEDLTGYTFTIDENSPDTVIFEVTNTGDIAVMALTSLAVICIVGIIYILRKNKVNS